MLPKIERNVTLRLCNWNDMPSEGVSNPYFVEDVRVLPREVTYDDEGSKDQ
jgi:hypothetical protein